MAHADCVASVKLDQIQFTAGTNSVWLLFSGRYGTHQLIGLPHSLANRGAEQAGVDMDSAVMRSIRWSVDADALHVVVARDSRCLPDNVGLHDHRCGHHSPDGHVGILLTPAK